MQLHFTYIIYSETFDIYYKGYSTHPENRVVQHNQNESRYTANKGPWKLVYLKAFDSKTEALVAEKRIKKLNRRAIESLIVG